MVFVMFQSQPKYELLQLESEKACFSFGFKIYGGQNKKCFVPWTIGTARQHCFRYICNRHVRSIRSNIDINHNPVFIWVASNEYIDFLML